MGIKQEASKEGSQAEDKDKTDLGSYDLTMDTGKKSRGSHIVVPQSGQSDQDKPEIAQ
jgi:hypothetical protein